MRWPISASNLDLSSTILVTSSGPSSGMTPAPLRAACRESDGWWAEFSAAQPAPLRRGSFDLFAHPAAEEACLYTKRELTLEDDAEELAALRKWHVCRVE